MLGGVLLFEIHLAEPFFIAKLRIIECSRLQTKASSALVNQASLSVQNRNNRHNFAKYIEEGRSN